MTKRIFILTIGFCLGGMGKAIAQDNYMQTKQDSILNAQQDSIMNARIKSDASYQVKVNALEYSMQKRHRPGYKNFVNDKIWDNLFIDIWGGTSGLYSRADNGMKGGTEIGVSATKHFSPYNAARVSGIANNGKRKLDDEAWSSLGVLADHLFNVTTYINGFNPKRLLEISTVEGFGAHYSLLGGEKQLAWDLHLGAQMRIRTGTRLDFFFEPRISLFADNIDISKDDNWHKYDVGYSAYLGMGYRLGNSYGSNDEESFWENTFVSFSEGIQMQNSANAREGGLGKALGPTAQVSVGKWLLNSFGIRLSVFGSYNTWKWDRVRNQDKLSAYGGGRLEAMLNPYSFFVSDIRSVKWGVIPMIGVEAGIMKKQDDKAMISKNYAALTAGIQFKYYVEPDLALFLEPRMSNVPYSFSKKNFIGRVEETSFSDQLWSISLGVEVRSPQKQERQARARKKGFKPYTYSSVGLGIAYPMQLNRYRNRRPGSSLTATLGRQISPVSGIRFGADAGNMYSWNSGWEPRTYLTGSVDYTFDVTNFIAGYDPARKWNAELFAGPVLTKATNAEKSLYLGGEAGGRLGLQVYDNWGIYAEPKFRCYKDYLIPNGGGAGTRLQMNLSVGTSYRFGLNYRKAAAEGFGDGTILGNTFISLSEGLQNTVGNLKGNGMGRIRTLGPTASVAFGKWLVDLFGLRFSAFASSNSYARINAKTGQDALAFYLGGRMEGMLNPIALFYRGDEKPRWGIIPMAGLELGILGKQQTGGILKKKYAALTGGLQFKYYATDHIAIFVEPHATRIPYTVTRRVGKKLQSVMVADNLMSFSVGIELSRLSGLTMNKLSLAKVSFEPYNFASASLGLGALLSLDRYTSQKPGIVFDVSAGRQFTPYSALRAGVEFMTVPPTHGAGQTFSYTSLSLDYMLAVSNIMAGYDEERPFGVDLFGGPVYSIGMNGGGLHFGLEGGARVYYKMKNGFDLYVEPKFRAYRGKFETYRYKKANPFMSFSLGTSYRF